MVIFYFKKKIIESFNGSSDGELCKQGTASGKCTSVLSGAVIYAQTLSVLSQLPVPTAVPSGDTSRQLILLSCA